MSFDPIWSWPKPAQRPYPLVLVGGAGSKVLDRVLAYGDGWIPNYNENVLRRAAELRIRAADQGKAVTVQVMLGSTVDAHVLESLESAGVERVLLWLPSAGTDRVARAMDAFEAALADARGERLDQR